MDNLSKRFNEMLMQEMGFDVLNDGKLVDQDMGIPIMFEGVPVVAPSVPVQRGETEVVSFDPYNNNRMMGYMFGHFMNKMATMGEIENYDVIYNEDIPGTNGGIITIRNKTDAISSSKPYVRESCKYADLVFQINGDEIPDMKDFDISKSAQKDAIRRAMDTKYERKTRGKR